VGEYIGYQVTSGSVEIDILAAASSFGDSAVDAEVFDGNTFSGASEFHNMVIVLIVG
jgi:hypothetical protein